MANLEVDMSLALQLQAQFEEELRVSLLKQEAEQSQIMVLHEKTPVTGPGKGNKSNKYGELEEPSQEKLSVSLIDPSWELIDPNPDIHTLFLTFNNQFFWGRLAGVEVRWSPRMTLCAGVCCYEGRGGLCSVRLSLPLLKLRPRKDLIETLLHEMIHAYLFVTANNRDRDGHGPEFHKHMYRLNGIAGTKISVYHSFHDEVDVYRQHIWQCNGPCRQRRPYFGLVKRAMNRAPGPRDPWWQQHQQSCGGTYSKIQEPEGYGVKNKRKGSTMQDKELDNNKNNDIRKFFGGFKGNGKSLTGGSSSSGVRKKDFNHRTKDGNSPPFKENIPGYNKVKGVGGERGVQGAKRSDVSEGGVGRGTKRNGVSEENSSSSSFKKASNVHGLGSTATGTVRQINVNNASRSKVHGFGGSSPISKKPRVGSGAESGGTSQGNKSGSSGAGTGLAVRSGGGSKTVTVKGKAPTKTQIETPNENSASAPCFQGQGQSLGGRGSGVSRLLSLSSSSSALSRENDRGSNRQPCTDRHDSHFQNSATESPGTISQIGSVKCPVCSKVILESILKMHLSDCIGDFDDDDDSWDECNATQAPSNKDEKEVDTISVSSDDSDDFPARGNSFPATSSTCRIPSDASSTEDTYPCPVCSERFSQANINAHLDTHF